MLTASNTEGSTYAYSFQHNGAGQVTSVTKPFAGASLSFGYDLAGNRTSVSDSFGGTESLGYDADNNLTTLTYGDAGDSLSISFTYNQANQMTQEQMYSSGSLIATVAETYDGAGNVKNITYENSSSAVIDSFSYIYDQANELMSEMDSSGATTMNYTYNDLGELTAAGLQLYSYDAAGNPNSGADGLVGGSPSSAGNELSEYVVPSDIPTIAGDTITYTYDTAGNEMTAANLTASTTWSYGYDNANHMTSAMETVSGTLTEAVGYVYDVFGNLIRETVVPYSGGMSGTPTTMDFLMDGWNPAKAGGIGNSKFDTWAVLNGSSGLVETRNIQGNGIDQILARIDNASHGASDTGLFFDLTDRLGSVRYVLSSTSDTTVATINYDAWGNILTAPSTSMGMYAWDGYDYDAVTKLYLDNARDYDSVSERWLAQDPMGFDAGDSNLYRYVNNSPMDGVDASGMEVVTEDGDVAASIVRTLDLVGIAPEKVIAGKQNLGDTFGKIDITKFQSPEGIRYVLMPTDLKKVEQVRKNKDLGEPFQEIANALGSSTIHLLAKSEPGKAISYTKLALASSVAFDIAAVRNGVPDAYRKKFFAAFDAVPLPNFFLAGKSGRIAIITAHVGGFTIAGGAIGAAATSWSGPGAGVGFGGGAGIGFFIGTATGIYHAFSRPNVHEECYNWVVGFEKELNKQFGQNPKAGSNGGISKMGFYFWDTQHGNGEGHTTWRVLFKDNTEFFLDGRWVAPDIYKGFIPGPVLRNSNWTVEKDLSN